jgi:hypothetical protein
MEDYNIICWWKYPSIWALFGIIVLVMTISFLCAYFISNMWCLLPIGVICTIGGYFIRKIFPKVLRDIKKEFDK